MGHVRIVSDIRAHQQVWLNVLPRGTRVMIFYCQYSIRIDHEALCGLSDVVTFHKEGSGVNHWPEVEGAVDRPTFVVADR